jgi:hypothetical protein
VVILRDFLRFTGVFHEIRFYEFVDFTVEDSLGIGGFIVGADYLLPVYRDAGHNFDLATPLYFLFGLLSVTAFASLRFLISNS